MKSLRVLQLIRAQFRIPIDGHPSWMQYSILYERTNYAGYFHSTPLGDYHDDLDAAIVQSIVNHFNNNIQVSEFTIQRNANLLYGEFAENVRISMSGLGFGYDTNNLSIFNSARQLLIASHARIYFKRRRDELVNAMMVSVLPRRIDVNYQPEPLKQIFSSSFIANWGQIGDPFIV